MKPTGKTTEIISRLTEADERGYLLSNEVLLRLKHGQGLDEFWAVAGPKCELGEFIWIICILFTHFCVLSFTYQKRTPFYSPLISLMVIIQLKMPLKTNLMILMIC